MSVGLIPTDRRLFFFPSLFSCFLFFRMRMPENGNVSFWLRDQSRTCVCLYKLHFWSLSQGGATHKHVWHCGPHEASSATRCLCCRFINTMQRRGDEWQQLHQNRTGVFRDLDYQHFYEAFSFPLWSIVLLWPLAPSSSSHHTPLRISDCIMSLALVSGQYAELRLYCIIHVEQSGFNIWKSFEVIPV